MTHNEERKHWMKEGAIGLGVGVLYGVSNVMAGHPFDTIKTKMQAQVGFESEGMVKSFMKTLKAEGIVGLYRGCVPPLWGSGIYRSTQFAMFEAVYTYSDGSVGRTEIPGTAGLQLRVIAGGLVASTARAIIETPLEYAKVRRQTKQVCRVRLSSLFYEPKFSRKFLNMQEHVELKRFFGLSSQCKSKHVSRTPE